MTHLAWGHDTGTIEMPRVLPDLDVTRELGVLDLPPAVEPTRPTATALPRRTPRFLRNGWLYGLLAAGVALQLVEAVTR